MSVPSSVRRSSTANTSDGLAMPITGVLPRKPIASTRCLRASASGISFVASESSGCSLRSTNSMPASAAEARIRSSSETRPSSLRISPRDLPVAACSRKAASISSLVTCPEVTSSSASPRLGRGSASGAAALGGSLRRVPAAASRSSEAACSATAASSSVVWLS